MGSAHRDVAGMLTRHQYRQLKKIGEGSFGSAVLVEDADKSQFVCKMVDVSQASQKETQDAIREGKLLSAFKHPYIVRYRESFLDSGWLCILMDFCEGGDLTKKIEEARKRRTQIPEDQVLRWFTQCILALKYLHEKHVLHRDLKPGNFFLSKGGNMKMGDFGIAKVLSCTMACARTQIGTPYYLSPEVCQEKPYAWPSDIWAMGAILFELCALKVPFDAPNISGLVQKICRGPTPVFPQQYSEFVRNLGQEMLSRRENARPTAEDILKRPPIQAIVQQLFAEAQAGANAEQSVMDVNRSRLPSSSSASNLHGGAAPPPASGEPGSYRRGDVVEYLSSTHKDWLPASVINHDSDGRIIIDLKPNTWIGKEEQAAKIRPRRVAAMGRQRSHSVGQRALTPSRMRDASPGRHDHRAGGGGSRAGTPSRWRPGARDGSPTPMVGSRGGTPSHSRAGTPGQPHYSPRGMHVQPPHHRGSEPVLPVLAGAAPPAIGSPHIRPPGLPRKGVGAHVDGRSSAARAAGMAIAGQ